MTAKKFRKAGTTMMSRTEMIHYLGLYEDTIEEFDLSSTIDTAMEMQKTYDLNNGYGLGLECDFDSTPHVLEDLKDNEELVEVERENGVVVYCKKEREV